MAQEPDNLVLIQLREMRGQLNGITGKLEAITAKLEEHDRRFDDFHLLTNHALGLGMVNQNRVRELEARHDLAEAWHRRVEQRFDQIEHRLTKVEERSDT
jgi:hypothetical protein